MLIIVVVSFLCIIAIECDDLDDIINGEVVYDNNNIYTSVAEYSCKFGFELVGVEIRTCRENGEWSDEEPLCKSELFTLNEN